MSTTEVLKIQVPSHWQPATKIALQSFEQEFINLGNSFVQLKECGRKNLYLDSVAMYFASLNKVGIDALKEVHRIIDVEVDTFNIEKQLQKFTEVYQLIELLDQTNSFSSMPEFKLRFFMDSFCMYSRSARGAIADALK